MIREQIKHIQNELHLNDTLDGFSEILNTVLYEYMTEKEAIGFIIDSLMILDKEFNEFYEDTLDDEDDGYGEYCDRIYQEYKDERRGL